MKKTNHIAFHNITLLAFSVYTYLHCIDKKDWLVENILVMAFLVLLNIFNIRSKTKLSTFNLSCVYIFLFLHEWGAQYSYSQHPFGNILQHAFGLHRNGYDRLVHSSFGFLFYFPLHQLLHYKYKLQLSKIPLRAMELVLCFASIFELVEFAVGNYIFPNELGKTYVGTQGDIWDAQKDIAVALIGCTCAIVFVKVNNLITSKYKNHFEFN